jgi:hypothetical protein
MIAMWSTVEEAVESLKYNLKSKERSVVVAPAFAFVKQAFEQLRKFLFEDNVEFVTEEDTYRYDVDRCIINNMIFLPMSYMGEKIRGLVPKDIYVIRPQQIDPVELEAMIVGFSVCLAPTYEEQQKAKVKALAELDTRKKLERSVWSNPDLTATHVSQHDTDI